MPAPQEGMQAHAVGPASRELGDLGPGVQLLQTSVSEVYQLHGGGSNRLSQEMSTRKALERA